MKKINYFLLLIAMICSFSIEAKNTLVKNATDLITVFNAAQGGDTISCAPGYYNVSNKLYFPITGIITVKSQYTNNKDSMAILGMNIQGKAIPSGVAAGLIFDHMHLQHNNPTATSGHIIYINKVYGNIAKLIFRNCEISNGVRGLFRSVKPENTTTATYTSCGDLEYLEMTNCLVHNTFVTSGNNWPLLYLGHIPVEVNISNNTFYDLPYMKNIFTMNYADPQSGRNAKFTFKNNTISTTMNGNAYVSTGNYLGEEAEFTFENNVFALPNWSNSLNQPSTNTTYTIPAIIRCRGGIITAKNNLVQGPLPWLSGQSLDADGQGGFVVIDTTNTYTMANLNFAWTDFADPEKADYSYFSTKSLATSGTSGAPIGDPRWVKSFTNPKTLTVTANNTNAVVTPRRAYYESGTTATVKASTVDGYVFKGWKKVSDGSLVSADNPYNFSITSDVDLVADYALLQERKVTISISGSNSASYAITPSKTIYYEGDVITVALNKHYINDFKGWSDGNMDLSRTFTISADITLTANFTEHPYFLAWDFHQITSNNQAFTNLAANHAINSVNPGVMNYVSVDTIRTISTRNNKFSGDAKEIANCVARRTIRANFANPDYLFVKFSTKGITNMKVKSMIGTDNSIYKVQKLQYSLNGKNYTDFKSDTISGNIDAVWLPLEGVLPVAAENQDSVWVRWIADPTSERLFVTGVTDSDYDYAYISKIIVINSTFTAINDVNKNQNFAVYATGSTLIIKGDEIGRAEIFNTVGQKIKQVLVNEGTNRYLGLKSGAYFVKIGSVVHKIMIE